MAHSSINWKRGVTVQVLARHHEIPTSICWAHNLLEKEPTQLERYDCKPKPAGWGNGGGGLEPDDLDKLKKLFPGHPILTDTSLSEDEKLIISGGIREFLSETGYRDFDIITDYPGVYLYDYTYKDWVSPSGIVHPGGHRKITLWGQMNSYKIYEADRIEKHEVDKTDWFDLAEPLPSFFFNPFTHPDRPYWSHVRFSLVSLLRIHGYLKANSDDFVPDIPSRIHPSWWYIIKVGVGHPSFPAGGHKPSPEEWYNLFHFMVKNRLEEVDNDFLADFFHQGLNKARIREEERLAKLEQAAKLPETDQAVEGSEDSDGFPTLEDMRRQEDEECGRWYETTIPEELRVIK